MKKILKTDIKLLYNLCLNKEWPHSKNEVGSTYISKVYDTENAEHVIDFCGEEKEHRTYALYFIRNKDNSIRWMLPTDAKEPRFLKFYSANTLKSKLYAESINLYYKLGQQSKFQTEILILKLPSENRLTNMLENLSAKEFSIFLGTKGISRKIIVEAENELEQNFFVKIPVTEFAEKLVKKEIEYLKSVKDSEDIVYPKLHEHNSEMLIQENTIAHKSFKRINAFDASCEKYLCQNLQANLKSQDFEMSSFYKNSVFNLKELENVELKENLKKCYIALVKFNKQLDVKGNYKFHLAHGDFTPWNIYQVEDKLYVYDWELQMDFAPLYYDFFHFHFQKGILQERKSFQKIYLKIKEKIKELKLYNLKEVLNWQKYLAVYIWHMSSYYLNLYQKQEVLHEQVDWLVKTWEDALNWACTLNEGQINRKEFAFNFFQHLNKENIKYAWLKSCKESIFELKDSSDVDVLVQKSDLGKIASYLKMHSAVVDVKSVKQSFMHTYEVFLNNGEIVHFDFINQFKRTNKVYLKAKNVLSNRMKNEEGVFISSAEDDYNYCLNFYQLNGSGVPKHYVKYFESCGLKFPEMEKHSVHLKENLQNELKNHTENKAFKSVVNSLNYGLDKLRLMGQKRGFIVSFSGVDGAGKSTVISNLKKLLEQKYRKEVVVLRHRPSLLPILSSFKYGKEKAEKIAAEKLPRQGTNQSKINSVLRFFYYYSDYLFGQFVVYSKYILRGKIVLYDRYYFDFINDPKRSNLNMNESLPLAFSKFVIKPDINILLTAPADEILKRKQELTAEDIEKLTSKYKKYFKSLENRNFAKFKTIENINLDTTLLEIENEIKTSYIN